MTVQFATDDLFACFSSETGQVTGLGDTPGRRWLRQSEDRYDLAGARSSEAADTVVSVSEHATGCTFECTNQPLGLSITKRYELAGAVLVKTARYRSAAADRRLLKVSSESLVEPDLVADGWYYQAIDDPYKMMVSMPFVPGGSITSPRARHVASSFTFYLPAHDRVLAHYRHLVNGAPAITDYFWAGSDIGAEFVPGGAVTALGQDFVDAEHDLELVSHHAVLAGDPRASHRHTLTLSPYVEYAGRPVPSWFGKVRMFFGDKGTGQALMEDLDGVLTEVQAMLDLTAEDEFLMVFFEHWSTSGWFPTDGDMTYYTFDQADPWSAPFPVARFREHLAAVKALSPRVKVGGYVIPIPAEVTPAYIDHPEWFSYNEDGSRIPGHAGIGLSGMPDYTSGYCDVLAAQLRSALADLGFDWHHVDFGPAEMINWATKNVIQSGQAMELFRQIADDCAAVDAAMVENGELSSHMYADGSYFELYQADRFEERDWRSVAIAGHLAVLGRTHRPGTWVNLVFGPQGIYSLRAAQSGMRGWIRGSGSWWRYVSQALAFERVADELLGTELADLVVSPSFWRFESDELEVEAMRRGEALILALWHHAPAAGSHEITFDSVAAGFDADSVLFAIDLRLLPPTDLDPFAPAPIDLPAVEVLGIDMFDHPAATYARKVSLEPMRNYYHVLTHVPGLVHSVNGRRTSLPLPDNGGVRVAGRYRAGESSFRLYVRCDVDAAQLAVLVPATWSGVAITTSGGNLPCRLEQLGEQRVAVVDVTRGVHQLDVAVGTPGVVAGAYEGVRIRPWEDGARRLSYRGASGRAFADAEGRGCLAIRATGAGTGSAVFGYSPTVIAGGAALSLLGTGDGSLLTVQLGAGLSVALTDDEPGWREIVVRPADLGVDEVGVGRVGSLEISTDRQGHEVVIADVRLLPPTELQLERLAVDASAPHVTARWTALPIVVDGHPGDPAWSSAQRISDFVSAGNANPTIARVAWDDDGIYVLVESLDPLEKRGQASTDVTVESLAEGQHVQVYLVPPHGVMYQVLVDPDGSVAVARTTAAGPSPGWAPAIKVATSLNWQASWVSELFIPFADVGGAPAVGEEWELWLARRDLTGATAGWGEWSHVDGWGKVHFTADGTAT